MYSSYNAILSVVIEYSCDKYCILNYSKNRLLFIFMSDILLWQDRQSKNFYQYICFIGFYNLSHKCLYHQYSSRRLYLILIFFFVSCHRIYGHLSQRSRYISQYHIRGGAGSKCLLRSYMNVHIRHYRRLGTAVEAATFVWYNLMTVFASIVGGRFTFDVKIILYVCRWYPLIPALRKCCALVS